MLARAHVLRGPAPSLPARSRGARLLAGAPAARRYFVLPMRQIVLPHTGHVPFVMGFPFFVVLATGSFMTFFSLHFMQYASTAMGGLLSLDNSWRCYRRLTVTPCQYG